MTSALLAPPAIQDSTRREFLVGIAAAGLLVGCGTRDEGAAAAPTEGFPRTIDHQEGTTVIPSRPQRIVAIDARNDLDALVALGIAPVAAAKASRFSSLDDPETAADLFYGGRLNGVTILKDGYDLEAVAAAAPDLILGQNIGDPYPTFARIAPTISITFEDWRTTTRMIGRATGADAEAEAYVARFDADVAELAVAPGTRPSVAIIEVREGGAFVVRNDCNAHRLLVDLGFTTALGVDGKLTEFSAERAGELDAADRLFVLSFLADDAAGEAFQSSELFTRLRPVREGRSQVVGPNDAYNWYFPTALTAPLCLKSLSSSVPELMRNH